ncbi:MAG: YggT family protein [Coriobacteriales bacterium]|jgi:YggT family protein|nr:YggT family protein [Coriobacteriales bacterium]
MPVVMLISVVSRLVDLYVILIVVWAIFSWFDHSKGILNDIYKVLDTLVGPYIKLFKRIIPPLGGIDITPIIAILALELAIRALQGLLMGLL